MYLYELFGMIKTVTTAPTKTPTRFEQQIVLYTDSLASPSTRKLYIYSNELKDWLYVDLST